MTPSRPGIRLPNSPSWRPTSPNTKDTHALPLLWQPQRSDPPGDSRRCHRATLGRSDAYLSGRHHIGRRGVEEIVETVFEVPTSLGSVSALEGETSAALASPYQEAQAAVREAPVKNTDETSWKGRGINAGSGDGDRDSGFFRDSPAGNFAGLQALLGETITGIVCGDRWSVYNELPEPAPSLLGPPETRLSETGRSRRAR